MQPTRTNRSSWEAGSPVPQPVPHPQSGQVRDMEAGLDKEDRALLKAERAGTCMTRGSEGTGQPLPPVPVLRGRPSPPGGSWSTTGPGGLALPPPSSACAAVPGQLSRPSCWALLPRPPGCPAQGGGRAALFPVPPVPSRGILLCGGTDSITLGDDGELGNHLRVPS